MPDCWFNEKRLSYQFHISYQSSVSIVSRVRYSMNLKIKMSFANTEVVFSNGVTSESMNSISAQISTKIGVYRRFEIFRGSVTFQTTKKRPFKLNITDINQLPRNSLFQNHKECKVYNKQKISKLMVSNQNVTKQQ